MLFCIELGEDNNVTYMYVNYYFKYASVDKNKNINDADFIIFLSTVAYFFGIKHVILYTEYTSCDLGKKLVSDDEIIIYKGGNYCIDFYDYLKKGRKRFGGKGSEVDSMELKPQFSYYDLDRLGKVAPSMILRKEDRDELYQIYAKIYKPLNRANTIADFYVWMVENQCVYLNLLVKSEKMGRLYTQNNPYKNDYYILDAFRYLYNKELINIQEPLKASRTEVDDVKNRLPKNEYRLQYYRRE